MSKDTIIGGIIISVACIAAATWIVWDHSALHGVSVHPQIALEPPKAPEAPPPPPAVPLPAITRQIAPPTQPAPPVVIQPSVRENRPAPRPNQNQGARQTPISEPAAREALKSVGADPDAEAVWARAINDSTLDANARKNLIEDLNETGFADPRNITPADLPLIENRLALIETMAPDAMDDVNAAAFQEAYKDLVNMRARLVQQ